MKSESNVRKQCKENHQLVQSLMNFADVVYPSIKINVQRVNNMSKVFQFSLFNSFQTKEIKKGIKIFEE
jgi:hypothetical protein